MDIVTVHSHNDFTELTKRVRDTGLYSYVTLQRYLKSGILGDSGKKKNGISLSVSSEGFLVSFELFMPTSCLELHYGKMKTWYFTVCSITTNAEKPTV